MCADVVTLTTKELETLRKYGCHFAIPALEQKKASLEVLEQLAKKVLFYWDADREVQYLKDALDVVPELEKALEKVKTMWFLIGAEGEIISSEHAERLQLNPLIETLKNLF